MTTDTAQPPRPSLATSVAVAAMLMALAASLRFLGPDQLDPDLARRVLGIAFGLVVVFYANAAPKVLTPLMSVRCDPAVEQAHRRFAGWSLVVGGLGYAAAWAFAPIEHANLVAMIVLATALAMLLIRLAWSRRTG